MQQKKKKTSAILLIPILGFSLKKSIFHSLLINKTLKQKPFCEIGPRFIIYIPKTMLYS